MKKISSILIAIIISLAIAGCSSQKPAKEEVVVNKEQPSNEKIVLEGTAINNADPSGEGMFIYEQLEFEGKKYSYIYFAGESVYKYIDRKLFDYDSDFGTVLSEDFAPTVSIEIEVDKDSLYKGDYGYLYANKYKVISVCEKKDLKDRTNEEYSTDYYKQVFFKYCYEGDEGARNKDVKETYYYKNIDSNIGDIYKVAVDYLLDKGYTIKMSEGDYYIDKK